MKAAKANMIELREALHSECFVCASSSASSLGLRFRRDPDGGVTGEFPCDPRYQGYAGVIHGGIVAALLDGAMTHCLFAAGVAGVTADLRVRFRHPLLTARPAVVRARISRASPPLYLLEASIVQGSQTKATAAGKFMKSRAPAGERP